MDRDSEFFQDYSALTAGAGFVNVSGRTQIEITGDDRAAFLHNLTTAPIRSLQPGQRCEAFVLDVRGHTLGHLLVFCTPHSLVIDADAGENERLAGHFERYHIREKIEICDRSGQWGELLIAGNKSWSMLESLIDGNSPSAVSGQQVSHCQTRLADQTAWLRNVEIIGAGSMLVSAPRESIDLISAALAAAGIWACGCSALASLRIEAGWPRFGTDITDKNLPQEIGRTAQAISFTKGCYLGQETVARIDALGHINKTLCGVRFSGPELPAVGTEIRAGDAVAGTVTSAAFSPRLSAPLAFAYIRRGFEQAGTKLTGSSGDAEVVALPLR